MKKLFTASLVTLFIALVLASCVHQIRSLF